MAACAEFFAISSTIASTSSTSRCTLKVPPPTTLPGALQFNGLRISTAVSGTSPLRRCLGRSGNYCLSAGRRRGLLPVAAACSTSGSVIIIVSFEVAPWSKTGGLGDVIGGLAPALAARGNRVMTVAPRHDQYKDAWDTNVSCELLVGDEEQHVRYFHTYKRGVDRVFVDHPSFLEKVWGKTGSKVYGPVAGNDYKDNQLRFSLFAQAAIEAARVLNLNCGEHKGPYGEDVIFVANDWHTALLPCYLKAFYQSKGLFVNAKVAFCIHNIAYQGRFAPQDFSLLNLPDSFRNSFDFYDGHDVPVKGWKINWMKAGMVNAHIVLTVSPNYALEILSGPERGVELELTAQETGIIGITNGLDIQDWDPSTDKHLDVNYDITTVVDAKPVLKEILRTELGLPQDTDVPLIGFIGRLEEQKGSDILMAAMPEILKDNVQLIVLGTGKEEMEEQIKALEAQFPTQVRAVVKFDVPLAHLMIAAVSFMVIPSRFEPCGLNQLYCMRYGTIPVVASTGGLVDTVEEGVTGFQTARSFNVKCEEVDAADVECLVSTIRRALKTYETPAYYEMMKAGMAQDLSWKAPAKRWEEVLVGLTVRGSSAGMDGEEIAPLPKEHVAAP